MSLKFTCPNCHENIPADPAQAGQAASCPKCEWTVRMPQIEALMENLDVIKFLCPSCGRKLSASRDQFGTEMPCPFTDCVTPILVPRPDWKPVPTTILKKAGGEQPPGQLISEAEEITRKSAPLPNDDA